MSGRVMDWRTDLLRWAWEQPGKPFEWGKTDCVSLAREALAICFGRDIFPDAPHWSTAREAAEAFAVTGGIERALKALGAEEHPLNFARAGDVVCFDEPDEGVGGVAVGIWVDNCCLLSAANGVLLARRTDMPEDSRVYSLWEVAD